MRKKLCTMCNIEKDKSFYYNNSGVCKECKKGIKPLIYKRCICCGIEKDVYNFRNNSKNYDGLNPYCNKCWWYPEEIKNKKSKLYKLLKKGAIVVYPEDKPRKERLIYNPDYITQYSNDLLIKLLRRLKSNNKRCNKLGIIGEININDILSIYNIQNKSCYYCNSHIDLYDTKKYHIDHYKPISRGGLNKPDNIVIACSKCNLVKNAKLPRKFIESIIK